MYLAHAYNRRESVTPQGNTHIITEVEINIDRLHRKPGDALCKPSTKFWGLDRIDPQEGEPKGRMCPKCQEILKRLNNSDIITKD